MSIEWQPIETAPKDGTRILVWALEGYGIAYWGNGAYNRSTRSYDLCWVNGLRVLRKARCFRNVTHWMPLPNPPKQEA